MTTAIGGTLTPLVYVTLVPSAAIVLSSTPTFTFALPAGFSLSAGSSVYVGLYDPTQSAAGWQVFLGPGSVSGQTITFAAVNRTIVLTGGATYTFALFSTGQTLAPVTPTPSPSPSPSPTVSPLAIAAVPQNVIGPSSKARKALSTSSINAVPIIVAGTGYQFSLFEPFDVWVYNTQSGQKVTENSMTAMLTPNEPLSGPVAPDTAPAYSGDWYIGLEPNTVSKVSIAVSFGDGTNGVIPAYVYDTWDVTCSPLTSFPLGHYNYGVTYQSGAPMPTTAAAGDIAIDCVGLNLVFQYGAVVVAAPQVDAWGNVLSQLPSVTKPVAFTNPVTSIPLANVSIGEILVIKTSTGAFAKIMPDNSYAIDGNVGGISLLANPDGSYAF